MIFKWGSGDIEIIFYTRLTPCQNIPLRVLIENDNEFKISDNQIQIGLQKHLQIRGFFPLKFRVLCRVIFKGSFCRILDLLEHIQDMVNKRKWHRRVKLIFSHKDIHIYL